MSPKPRKRPKIADVAHLAGTSEAAVSVVLNGRVGESARVSEETQARIWDAVRQLGYTANPVARSLAGGRNRIIGVFTFEPTFPIESRDFYYPFLVGVEAEAAAQDYDLLLFASAGDRGKRTIYRNGINRLQLADGAVLLGQVPDRAELRRLLVDGYPFVFIGRRETPGYHVPYAAADYAEATAEIVQYMFAHNHQQVAYFRNTIDVESAADRERGVHTAYHRAGRTIDPDFTWRGSPEHLTAAVLTDYLKHGATAFVAENDEYGEAILRQMATLGLRCPADYSLGVLGDSMRATLPARDWTSFKIPRVAMGREAVRLLLKMLETEGGSPEHYQVTLPCTFIPGTTVAQRKDK
ncbi:MAG: LacI family DNA-binding transcriptional regulator [Anaerolineae bacterium]|nr:LacI family DNA-binding transcriptional regulator [Anaerolineae bacterium]